MKRPSLGITLCLVVIGTSVASISVIAQDNYSMTVENEIDIPTQEFEYSGETHEVSSLGVIAPGNTFNVMTAGPEEGYSLELYNYNRQIADSTGDLSGQDSASLNPGPESGTYILIMESDSDDIAIQPIIAEGYNVSLSAPEGSRVGETAEFSINVSQHNGVDKAIDSVQVVIATNGDTRQITAVEDGDGQYTATVELEQSGDVSVYAGVYGEERIQGQKEILGISNPQMITVQEVETTSTPDGSQSGGNQNGDTETTEEESTDNQTQTTTTADDESSSNGGSSVGGSTTEESQIGTAEPNVTTTDSEESNRSTFETEVGTTAEKDDNGTDDSVVTPVETTETEIETQTTEGTGPVGLPALLTALVVLLGSLRLWRHI